MDELHAVQSTSQVLPHIMQVYPSITTAKVHTPQIIHLSHPSLTTTQSAIAYQEALPQDIHITVSSQLETSQNQVIMHQHFSNVQTLAQVTQCPELGQPVLGPIIFPHVQQVIVDVQDYGHFGLKHTDIQKPTQIYNVVEKVDHCIQANQVENIIHQDMTEKVEESTSPQKKRIRRHISDPSKWQVNVRKQKHQRGEAYVSRRGKFVPARQVKNMKDCLNSCRLKCNENIADNDRELIFRAFYSLSANEKKHFLLNTTERHETKGNKADGQTKGNKADGQTKRKYSFKYFFVVRAVRYNVCKNFYLGTLAISQKPIYNVHSGKSDVNIPKSDGRGQSVGSVHALPREWKDRVRNHIMSFTTIDYKPIKQYSRKKQYLDNASSIKQMYNMYLTQFSNENIELVKESMYRKILKNEFNLHFKKSTEVCCKCKSPVKKR